MYWEFSLSDMSFWVSVLLDGLFAGIASLGFALISNPPKRTIFFSVLLAAIGHSARYVLMDFGVGITMGTFIGALMIGLLSVFFAKLLHTPAEIFSFPSLLPMIPGVYAYETVLCLVRFMNSSDNNSGYLIVEMFHNGLTTVFVMFAMVVGVSLPMFTFYKEFFSSTRLSRPVFGLLSRFKRRGK